MQITDTIGAGALVYTYQNGYYAFAPASLVGGGWSISGATLLSGTPTITGNPSFIGTVTVTGQGLFVNNSVITNTIQVKDSSGNTSMVVNNSSQLLMGTGSNYGIQAVAGVGLKVGCLVGGSGNEVQMVDSAGATIMARFFTGNSYLNSKTTIGSNAAPSALLMLAAGTASAGTGPLKFTSGINLTTGEAGAMEYNGTNLFFTRSGTARENVVCSVQVNSVSPTAPNRTVQVVLDGVTYYIAAKTTND